MSKIKRCEVCRLNPATTIKYSLDICSKCADLDMDTFYKLKRRRGDLSRKHFLGRLHGSWVKHLTVQIPPHYNNDDYMKMYGLINYKDKIVLDIGADVGSTAAFFLQWGANHVIAVEGGDDSYNDLVKNIEKFNLLSKVTPIHLWICCKDHFRTLIMKHRPDVIKADCEGCEDYLIQVDDDVFSMVPEYTVETHRFKYNPTLGRTRTKDLREKLLRNGYTIVSQQDHLKSTSLTYGTYEMKDLHNVIDVTEWLE